MQAILIRSRGKTGYIVRPLVLEDEMAAVNVVVNGRTYNIACNDGEEDSLKHLAAIVDGKLQEVVTMVGQIGDQRLLLMAALLIADDLVNRNDRLAEIEKSIAELKSANAQLQVQVNDAEGLAADKLEAAAKRVETVLTALEEK